MTITPLYCLAAYALGFGCGLAAYASRKHWPGPLDGHGDADDPLAPPAWQYCETPHGNLYRVAGPDNVQMWSVEHGWMGTMLATFNAEPITEAVARRDWPEAF